ncbi:MAG: UvrD-helicase domain-containing protein, partial [Desulfobacterales bacterium]
MTAFDLLQLPLDGVRLIEAGAGTGKTYSIEGLFLRLILEAGLAVDQILVLTFTVAATDQLRDRIRQRLFALRKALAEGAADNDAAVSALAARAGNRKAALRAADDALLDFDRAAVYTIHGFCQRLLSEYAFETGNPFDTALAADPGPLIEEVSSDFWRRHLIDAPPELAAHFFEQQMTGPDRLAALYGRLQRPGEVSVCGDQEKAPQLSSLEGFRRRLDALRDRWPGARDSVAAALMSPALKATGYGNPKGKSPETEATPRQVKVDALCRAMDRYLAEECLGFPTFPEFRRFTSEEIAKATRKGATVPVHPFFEACSALFQSESRLRNEMDRYLLWFKTAFVAAAPELLAVEKKRQNVLFYDDLLLRTREALQQERGLARAAANRYRAALVDEFQDTDPVQYEIFRRLFRRKDRALFMIGDPKQAIYGFRGADVFSYLAAADDADARYSLLENWRSAPPLIHAVNALFSGADRPFLLDGIDFAPARPARSSSVGKGEGGLEIWRVAGREDGRPLSKSEASSLLIGQVVDEIDRLLCSGRPAGQIAVLVRTNRQAWEVKSALSARRIPAVLYSAGSVFQSDEAAQLHYLLLGIASPADPGRVRAALTTELIGVSAAELAAGESDPDWWSRRAAPLVEDGRNWRNHGFIRMFQGLMEREQIRGRVLARPDGERRLTDLLHLVELCHRATTEQNLGPSGLLKWLAGRRESTAAAADEEQLRLESDALAVQVVTVHRSKGLEFPVVFVPFGWESSAARRSPELLFHDPEAGYRLTLDLGGGDRKRSERLARTEALAEDLRLLYVAVTRAKERCYLPWGRINQAEMAALTYLFHGAGSAAGPDPAADLEKTVKGLSESEFFAPLQRLA